MRHEPDNRHNSGIIEIRRICGNIYGVWVDKDLLAKAKNAPGLNQAGAGSNLFYIATPKSMPDTDESARSMFWQLLRK